MKEKWIRINTIEGYEDVREWYWLSNSDEDKIINRNIGKVMKISPDKYGYRVVTLQAQNNKHRRCRIHVLKAKAFIYSPNPLGANMVRHLNDVKTDNRLENLAWGTLSDNVQDCIRNGHYNYTTSIKNFTKGRTKGSVIGAKKTSKPVRCLETGIIYPNAYEASRQSGVSRCSISCCCHGQREHTAKGLHWEFVNKEVSSNELECEQIQ